MFRNALALVSSIFLWPCFLMSVVLLVVHSWMAASSMTSYECLLGAEPISYLKVRTNEHWVWAEAWSRCRTYMLLGREN